MQVIDLKELLAREIELAARPPKRKGAFR